MNKLNNDGIALIKRFLSKAGKDLNLFEWQKKYIVNFCRVFKPNEKPLFITSRKGNAIIFAKKEETK